MDRQANNFLKSYVTNRFTEEGYFTLVVELNENGMKSGVR